MLPMQRITRWPLLVDAVLKRLSPQDSEYLICQYALATLNKVRLILSVPNFISSFNSRSSINVTKEQDVKNVKTK